MKHLLIAILLFSITSLFGNSDLSSISTTLVIVEESENMNITTTKSPFTDGVLDSLWQRPYIFFDMKVDSELLMVDENNIDVKPFFGTAQASGADSVLLIKFQYEFTQVENSYFIKIVNIPYVLYSLNQLKALKSGNVTINMEKNITAVEKRLFLKDLGRRVLNIIYSSRG